jgi:hypothetical protein
MYNSKAVHNTLSNLATLNNYHSFSFENKNNAQNTCNLDPQSNEGMCQNMVNAAKQSQDPNNPLLKVIQNNPDYSQFVNHYAPDSCGGYADKMCSLIQKRTQTRENCACQINDFVVSAVDYFQQPCDSPEDCSKAIICLYSPEDKPNIDCSKYQYALNNIQTATKNQNECIKANSYNPIQ